VSQDAAPDAQLLLESLAREVNGTLATTQLAVAGARELVRNMGPAPTDDHPVFVGELDPAVHAGVPSISRSELAASVERGGSLERGLLQQWIVATFAKWELAYRPRFAALFGVAENCVRSDLFGDLRHLRNDIVHHGGIATSGNAGRCSVLHGLVPGDPIHLTNAHMLAINSSVMVRVEGEVSA
jgi:hypothetical protein